MERVALVGLDALDAGQFRSVQRSVGHDDEAGRHAVATVGVQHPAQGFFIPLHVGHLGLEAGVAVEVVLAPYGFGVLEDFRGEAVLLLRDIAELLDERQIDVRLDVALGARITVPIPSAAEVAALLDDADVLNARLAQPGTGQESAKAAADDDDVGVVRQGFPLEGFDIRILHEVGEGLLDLDVLLVAVPSEALVPLLPIPVSQRVGIETQPGIVGDRFGHSSSFLHRVVEPRILDCRWLPKARPTGAAV